MAEDRDKGFGEYISWMVGLWNFERRMHFKQKNCRYSMWWA